MANKLFKATFLPANNRPADGVQSQILDEVASQRVKLKEQG